MKRFAIIFITFVCSLIAFSATDDYSSRQARQYTQEAEYCRKKADGYRREAQSYLNSAESCLKEAAYYTHKGDVDRAKDYIGLATRAMDNYKTQMRYAKDADDRAADYLKRASSLLRK